MRQIGIVAAFPGELKPLVRGWERRGRVFAGTIAEVEAVAACAGMGPVAAVNACELALQMGPLDALLSVGWAGSLSCGLKPPEAVAVREVIDARSGERFSTENGVGQRLITLDHVASAEEKRRLAEAWQATLVDMEAAAVARLARARGLGFFCYKAVSDGLGDQLPDFHRFTNPRGQLSVPALALYAILHPQYWAALQRLGRNSRLAAEQLAQILSRPGVLA